MCRTPPSMETASDQQADPAGRSSPHQGHHRYAHHKRYTISEWRWFLEHSPVILAPYVDRSGQEVRRIVIAKVLFLFATRPSAQAVSDLAAAREPTAAFSFGGNADVHVAAMQARPFAVMHLIARTRFVACTAGAHHAHPAPSQTVVAHAASLPQTQCRQTRSSSNRRRLTHICLLMAGWQKSILVQP